MKPVSIQPVLNGWLVSVGCQTLVFNDTDTMLKELRSYIVDTQATHDRFVNGSVNKEIMGCPINAPRQTSPCPTNMDDALRNVNAEPRPLSRDEAQCKQNPLRR